MAGVKGRSGRKTKFQRAAEGSLEQLSTQYLIENFETFPPAVKLKISLTIASKMVVQQSQTSLEFSNKYQTEVQERAIAAHVRDQIAAQGHLLGQQLLLTQPITTIDHAPLLNDPD